MPVGETTTKAAMSGYCKARDIVGEQVYILKADFREGAFGREVAYDLVREDGRHMTLTLSRREFRERTVKRLWHELESNHSGVPATLIALDESDGLDRKVYLWDPLERGSQESDERRAWRAEQAQLVGEGNQDPRLGPEHRSWLRDQATDAVPDSAFADDEYDDPDDE